MSSAAIVIGALRVNPTELRMAGTLWSLAVLSAVGLRVAPILEGQHIPGEQTGSHKNFCSLKNCRRKWRCIHKKNKPSKMES